MNFPSQVWVGNGQELKKQAVFFLQKQFCKDELVQPCLKCVSCLQIASEQYYNIIWLEPQYKIDELRQVITRMSLRLAKDEHFYFVFQDAHCLNEAGASSLLKSIEEPPLGYHFLFLTDRKELLLDTILSRSIVQTFNSINLICEHDIYKAFTTQKLNPIEFNALLEKHKELTEQDSRTLLDQIYLYWLQQAKINPDCLPLDNKNLSILQNMLLLPPMPGSSKLFWRNLYLQF